jgi:hypothetical protein
VCFHFEGVEPVGLTAEQEWEYSAGLGERGVTQVRFELEHGQIPLGFVHLSSKRVRQGTRGKGPGRGINGGYERNSRSGGTSGYSCRASKYEGKRCALYCGVFSDRLDHQPFQALIV